MKHLKVLLITTISVVAILFVCALLFFKGVIKINPWISSQYPVHGVDVSSYQGKINWTLLEKQGIQFAFIKATEGSSTVDQNFRYNYDHAMKTELNVGAYHFFSFDSSGMTQANNFIATVPKNSRMLPPVVDLEFYGNKEKHPPNKALVRKNLNELLNKLEIYYGKKPIIYVTQKSYRLYISGGYSTYPLWISSGLTPPMLLSNRQYVFWQYSDKGKLKDNNGTEAHVDMNVFLGSQKQFVKFINK